MALFPKKNLLSVTICAESQFYYSIRRSCESHSSLHYSPCSAQMCCTWRWRGCGWRRRGRTSPLCAAACLRSCSWCPDGSRSARAPAKKAQFKLIGFVIPHSRKLNYIIKTSLQFIKLVAGQIITLHKWHFLIFFCCGSLLLCGPSGWQGAIERRSGIHAMNLMICKLCLDLPCMFHCGRSGSRGGVGRSRPCSWCRGWPWTCRGSALTGWSPSTMPRAAQCCRAEMR